MEQTATLDAMDSFESADLAAELASLAAQLPGIEDPMDAATVAGEMQALMAKMGEGAAGPAADSPPPASATFKFADASEEALLLLRISAEQSGASAYNTAVVLETAAKTIGASIRWTSAESLPVAETLDDAGGLFPELGADGYLMGELTAGGQSLATIHIRGDGDALFTAFTPDLREKFVQGFDFESVAAWSSAETARGTIELVGEFLQEQKDAAEIDAADKARLAEIEAERLAAVQAAKEAIDAAEAFGKTKAGFCGVVFDDKSYYKAEKAEGIKEALARKPAGSFAFVLQTDREGVTRAAMFSRQKIATGKRYRATISADGKIGNLQVSNMFATAANAYAAGVKLLQEQGGVVLGDAEPATKVGAAPTGLASQPSVQSPLAEKVAELRKSYPGKVVAYRMGDFYEFFEGDADIAKAVLNITLTSRNGIKMAGVPYHAADSSFAELAKAGHAVAVIELQKDGTRVAREVLPPAKSVLEMSPEEQRATMAASKAAVPQDAVDAFMAAWRQASADYLAPGYRVVGNAIGLGQFGINAAGEITAMSDDGRTASPVAKGRLREVEDAIRGGQVQVEVKPRWSANRADSKSTVMVLHKATGAFTPFDYAFVLPGAEGKKLTPIQRWGAELAGVLASSGPQAMLDRQRDIILKSDLTFGETAALASEFEKAAGKDGVQRLREWATPRAAGTRAHGAGLPRKAPSHLDAQRQSAWIAGYDSSVDTDWLVSVRDGTADVSDMRATVARIKALAEDELNGDFAKQAGEALTQRVMAKAKQLIASKG